MTRPVRLAWLVSHPIQYQAPLLRYLAAQPDLDVTALFLSDFSVRGYRDAGFGVDLEWDVPLLDGYRYRFLPAVGPRDPVTFLRPFVYGLRSALRGQFDALVLHGYYHQANLRALRAARSLGIRTFLRGESHLRSAPRSSIKVALKDRLLRRLFAGVDAFLAIGRLNREYYLHYGVPEERIFPMPYAVDNEFFQARAARARPEREALRRSLGLEPGRPVILFASKFQPRKRPDDLLEAYARLSPDGVAEPRPYLLLAGDGEMRAALEERVRALGWGSVRFLGFQNQTQLPGLYDLCDVFVLPSVHEPWGLVVNEVMNAGKPVIVTDQVGAAPDLVLPGETGYVVRPGDVRALSERLGEITADPELATRMGARALERISRWSFQEDLDGVRQALHATVSRDAARDRPVPGSFPPITEGA